MTFHQAEMDRQKHSGDKERIKALSDGVFAIAMTLLILELKIPEHQQGETEQMFMEMLKDRLPHFINFLMSFAIIGLYWIAHTFYFKLIKETNRSIMRLNLLFLFTVAFFPFPTAVINAHGSLVSAWIFYSVSLIMMGLSLRLIFIHAVKNNLMSDSLTDDLKKYINLRGLAVPSVFLFSIPVAFINIEWARLMPLAIPFVLKRISHAKPEQAQNEEE